MFYLLIGAAAVVAAMAVQFVIIHYWKPQGFIMDVTVFCAILTLLVFALVWVAMMVVGCLGFPAMSIYAIVYAIGHHDLYMGVWARLWVVAFGCLVVRGKDSLELIKDLVNDDTRRVRRIIKQSKYPGEPA